MNYLKQTKITRNVIVYIILMCSLSVFNETKAQYETDRSYDFEQLERLENEHMDYLKKIYRITKKYPFFSYTYKMEDGKVKSVEVTGVDNELDRKRLEVILVDLKSNKNMLKSKENRIGVFYSVDKGAEYVQGKDALQKELHDNLKYPEGAKDWGVEGTIFVKFVVDENGKIPFATASEDIETRLDNFVTDLENQAVSAVKATSGGWKPGKVNGINVPSLAIIPITFEFEKSPFLPAIIR